MSSAVNGSYQPAFGQRKNLLCMCRLPRCSAQRGFSWSRLARHGILPGRTNHLEVPAWMRMWSLLRWYPGNADSSVAGSKLPAHGVDVDSMEHELSRLDAPTRASGFFPRRSLQVLIKWQLQLASWQLLQSACRQAAPCHRGALSARARRAQYRAPLSGKALPSVGASRSQGVSMRIAAQADGESYGPAVCWTIPVYFARTGPPRELHAGRTPSSRCLAPV